LVSKKGTPPVGVPFSFSSACFWRKILNYE
jgi:hypothetical protein